MAKTGAAGTVPPDRPGMNEEELLVNDRLDLIPAALYARLSSDRQDVDLSVAAQLRVLRLIVYQCERYTVAYGNADTR